MDNKSHIENLKSLARLYTGKTQDSILFAISCVEREAKMENEWRIYHPYSHELTSPSYPTRKELLKRHCLFSGTIQTRKVCEWRDIKPKKKPSGRFSGYP